jgi:serine/threonine protein kinase
MTVTSTPRIPGHEYLRPLGAGGYADVYAYRQANLGREVAVKVLKSSGLTAALRQQFVVEANTMAGLGSHPYIVQIFDVGQTEDGRPYLTMELYTGQSLAERAERRGPLPVHDVLRVGIQVAGAVQTAHHAGILHRDIKPANILLSGSGAPALSDFGIAGRGGEDDGDGDVGVSVPWSPPEVLVGASNGSWQSDVYSLAATLWHLLVGRPPFHAPGGDNGTVAMTGRIQNATRPSTGRPDVPATLDRLLRQAMAVAPGQRPATVREFGRALQAVEQELRLPRTELNLPDQEPATDWTQRRAASTTPDATRVKPRVVDPDGPAQHPDRTVRRPSGAGFGLRTPPAGTYQQARPYEPPPVDPVAAVRLPAEPLPDRTIQRPSARPTELAEPAATPAGRRSRRQVWTIAAVALVVAGGIGVAVSLGGSPPAGTPDAVPTDEARDQDPAAGLVGTPIVSVRRIGPNYHFSWQVDPAPQPGDSFVWRNLGTGEEKPVAGTSLNLPVSGGNICIEVSVRRANTPPSWSIKACGK